MGIKEKLGLKTRKSISHETMKNIARMIKEEHPDWAMLNDDILIMLLKFTIRQYPTDTFNNMDEQELREKIRNAFISSTMIHKEIKDIARPDQILKLNAAYENGKKMGVKSKAMLGAITGALKKSVKKKGKNTEEQIILDE